MERSLLLTILATAILIYGSIPSEAYTVDLYGSTSISRCIRILQGGLISLYDEVELTPYTPIDSISLQGYPYDDLIEIDVYDTLGRISNYRLSNGSLDIVFDEPLTEEDDIHVSIMYRGVFSFKTQTGGPPEITVSIPSPTVLGMNVTSFTFRVETLKSFSWTSSTYGSYGWTGQGEGFLSYQTSDTSNIPRSFNVTFRGNFISAEILSLTKDVYVNWDGAIRIESTYRLRSLSDAYIRTIDLLIPEDAVGVDASDSFGNLRPINYRRAYSVAEVNLRYLLGYGEYASFTISYEAPKDYVDFNFLAYHHRVKIPIRLEYPSYMGRYRVNIHLPWTASIVDASIEGLNASIVDRGGDRLSVEVEAKRLDEGGFLIVSFNYTPFTIIGKYTGIVAAIILVVLIPLRSIKVKAGGEAATPKIVRLADELSKAYEDLFTLEDRIDSMISNALRKGSYSEVKSIRSRYSKEIENTLKRIAKLEDEIARSNPEARSMISAIREILSEADLAREQLELARTRYMGKAIGRVALERSERDYRKRIGSIRGRIGRILEDIKSI
ncbi:MAG: hypothetical protein RMJ00_02630 [Nitrososphaerota archaeon]|nr:hypothetical protein [Nitrososphaerota archaeon]